MTGRVIGCEERGPHPCTVPSQKHFPTRHFGRVSVCSGPVRSTKGLSTQVCCAHREAGAPWHSSAPAYGPCCCESPREGGIQRLQSDYVGCALALLPHVRKKKESGTNDANLQQADMRALLQKRWLLVASVQDSVSSDGGFPEWRSEQAECQATRAHATGGT